MSTQGIKMNTNHILQIRKEGINNSQTKSSYVLRRMIEKLKKRNTTLKIQHGQMLIQEQRKNKRIKAAFLQDEEESGKLYDEMCKEKKENKALLSILLEEENRVKVLEDKLTRVSAGLAGFKYRNAKALMFIHDTEINVTEVLEEAVSVVEKAYEKSSTFGSINAVQHKDLMPDYLPLCNIPEFDYSILDDIEVKRKAMLKEGRNLNKWKDNPELTEVEKVVKRSWNTKKAFKIERINGDYQHVNLLYRHPKIGVIQRRCPKISGKILPFGVETILNEPEMDVELMSRFLPNYVQLFLNPRWEGEVINKNLVVILEADSKYCYLPKECLPKSAINSIVNVEEVTILPTFGNRQGVYTDQIVNVILSDPTEQPHFEVECRVIPSTPEKDANLKIVLGEDFLFRFAKGFAINKEFFFQDSLNQLLITGFEEIHL